ncbi:MAG: HEAT repeat domain-containing protein, partial [Thermoanaerobaculia bacterium]
DEATRRAVVPQILVRGDVIEALPWSVWIESDPVRDGDLLAAAVVDANLVTAAPLLREVARISPSLRVVEALGCIGDDASIDLLDSLLTDSDGRMRVFIWNALGRIGGERVRAIFRRAASDLPSGEARFAYRAWAGCAASDDVQHFRSVAGDHDWLVRAAVADVLARYPDPSSSEVLSALALDPVEAVAEKAVAIAVTLDARK